MGEALDQQILDILEREREGGIAMGALVEEVLAQDQRLGEQAVELAIFRLLQLARVVPSGFVCRMVRKRDRTGQPFLLRTYELMIAPTPLDEAQLPLDLDRRP